ncbi:MAG: hypothetical protein ACOYN6_03150 [Ignavibacteria bacterium]
MNCTIGLYIDTDYIIAGILLYNRFVVIKSKDDNYRHYLYCFVNPNTNEINYGEKYKIDFENGTENVYGKIIENGKDGPEYKIFEYHKPQVELISEILNYIKTSYWNLLGNRDNLSNNSEMITCHICFSADAAEYKDIILSILGKNNIKVANNIPLLNLSVHLAYFLFYSNSAVYKNGKYLVIETLRENINLSVVSCNENTGLEMLFFEVIKGWGADPRVEAVAKIIVNKLNEYFKLLHSEQEITQEVKQQLLTAKNVLVEFEKPAISYKYVDAELSVQKGVSKRIPVKREDIDLRTKLQTSNVISGLKEILSKNNYRLESFDKYIILGNSFQNSNYLSEFSKNKLILLGEGDDIKILNGMLIYYDKATSNAKAEVKNNAEPSESKKELAFLSLETLKTGQFVYLITGSTVINQTQMNLEYIGEKRFRVLSSSSSTIKAGDEINSTNKNWASGSPVSLQIIRGGKPFPKTYNTKAVSRIELKNSK